MTQGKLCSTRRRWLVPPLPVVFRTCTTLNKTGALGTRFPVSGLILETPRFTMLRLNSGQISTTSSTRYFEQLYKSYAALHKSYHERPSRMIGHSESE